MIGTRRNRNWEHFFSEDNLASVFLISYVPNDKNKDRVRKIFKAIKIIINFPIIDVGKYLDQEKESSSNEKKVTTVRFKKDSLKGRNFFSLYKKVERRSKKIIRDPNKGFVKFLKMISIKLELGLFWIKELKNSLWADKSPTEKIRAE